MNRNLISIRVLISALLLAAIMQAGCRENTLVNSRIAPSNNTAGVWDTSLPCITHTYYDKNVITSTNIGGLSIYQGVGSIIDPFFGTMTGATYFQVIPANFSSTLYDATAIDSVVLLLPYSGFTYGDTANQSLTQSYQVFYLQDALSYDSAYYGYTYKAIDEANPLSSPTEVNLYHLKDTFSTGGVYYRKGLRIKLNQQAFMDRLAPAQAILTNSSTPATDFINLFKGVCVRVSDPTQTNTAIPYFRLDGSTRFDQAGISVYYHHTNVATPDTLVENYSFSTGNCAHFNSIARTYSTFPVNNLYTSTQQNDSIIALQNQPGASIDVVIPGLMKIPGGVINKAELQLKLLPGYAYGNLTGPDRLYPYGISNGIFPVGVSVGLEYNIADRYPLTSLSPLTAMDGFVHTFTENGKQVSTYTINLPREIITSIAAKNDTIHLHINGTQDVYGAFRMVAGGGSYSDPSYRPKLFVVYSKLNK